MKHLTLASIALGLSAIPALADLPQDAASAAALGQVDFTYNRSRPTPSAAERTPLQAKGVKLRDTILATPALKDRRGFALHASVVLEQPVAVGDPDMVWGGVISRRINVMRSQPDAAGRYRFETIRPGSYPGRDVPQHIHMHVIEPGRATYYIDDVMFADDPKLTAAQRRLLVSGRGGDGIAMPSRTGGAWHVVRDIALGANIPGDPA